MKQTALTFLLCLFTVIAYGQTHLSVDSLPQKEPFWWTVGWKWQPGDDINRAKPTYDDTKWQTIDLKQTINNLPQLKQSNMGWLRLQLWVDSSLVDKTLGVNIYQSVASEIYLDGKLRCRIGEVSKDAKQQRMWFAAKARTPLSITFNRSGIHVLAVRYALNPTDIKSYSRFRFFHIGLSDFQDYNLLNRWLEDIFLANYLLLIGVFFVLTLIYLTFYRFNKHQASSLYLALYAVGAIIGLGIDITRIGSSLIGLNIRYLINLPIIYLFEFFFLLAIYRLYAHKKDLFFYSIPVLMALISIEHVLLTSFTKEVPVIIRGLPYLLVSIGALRVCFKAYRQAKDDTLIVLSAQLITILAFGFYYSENVYWLFFQKALYAPLQAFWINQISFLMHLIATPIAIALTFTKDYINTSHKLARKVVEVEQLSLLTLAQEHENQQLLSDQNALLEQQVEARTAELRASQAQLIQKEKLASLGELTAGIAHEIQNPLNFVNNFSEVSTELVDELKEELAKGDIEEASFIADDLHQNLQKITHHGHRAGAIVRGMLEHARTSTGERTPTNLNALAEEYLRLAYHGLKAKQKSFDCQLITDFAPDLPMANVVAQDIGRVLLNLYNNAFYAVYQRSLQAGDSYEPTIWVSTQLSGGTSVSRATTIELRVRDNGTGIPDAVKAKIFQPFFTTKPTGEGTGLGLSLSYDIVTKGHGGRLEVDSREGEGAAFLIFLP